MSELIRRIFAEYYKTAQIMIPSLEKREFGVGMRKKIEARHLNFANVSEFRNYLCTNTPMFVSHSAAYYKYPGATPIQKKHWVGADLIFDLDIHAEGKYGAYAELEGMKKDLTRLVDDFISKDFGIPKEHVAVVFSGNRGYHVHVRDPAYLPLGGDERREIVDYIMGQGLSYLNFFPPRDSKGKLIGPRPDEGGYRGRFARETIKVLNDDPNRISRIFKDESRRGFFIKGIREGNWSNTTLKFDDLLMRLKPIAETLPVSSVNTDVGVTQDLSKLIRVPNTIHGDTGFIAMIVDDLEGFDPLRDAVIKSDKTMKVKFTEDVPELPMEGAIGFRKEEVKELPQHLAVLFYLKGSAYFI